MIFNLFLLVNFQLFATDFEGALTFIKRTNSDTVNYTFSVRNKKVRIDEKNNRQQIIQSVLIDIPNKTVTALSPTMKLYTTVLLQNQKTSSIADKDTEIIKTHKFKIIDGHKCYQWRLRNHEMNSDITYWVSECNFNFFNDIVSILSRTSDYSRFCNLFDLLPDANGFFPIVTVERSLLRDQKMQVELTRINKTKPNEKIFKIPTDYKFLRS
jgi:hypothetical protein